MNTSLKFALGLVLMLLLAVPGYAQESNSFDALPKEQRSAFEKLLSDCIKSYNRGQFDEALQLCQEASAISPHPATTYVFGRIADRQMQCEAAVGFYEEVINDAGAGQSEQLWLEDNKQKAQKHREALGACRANLLVDCVDHPDGLVTIADQLVGPCGESLEIKPGELEVSLWVPGYKAAREEVRVRPSELTEVDHRRLSKERMAHATVQTRCSFGPALVRDEAGQILAACEGELELEAGTHYLKAEGLEAQGLARVEVVDASVVEASFAQLRPATFQCADDEIQLVVAHEAMAEALKGTCGELAQAPALLPEGNLLIALSKTHHEARELEFELSETQQVITIGALQATPVEFHISCADPDSSDIALSLGSVEGICPLEGALPPGQYELRAVKDGTGEWVRQVELSHANGPLFAEVPVIEGDTLFWVGVITASAGGALFVSGAVVDIVGMSDLNELKDISENACADFDSLPACQRRHSELVTAVDQKILTTRVLYGLGMTALAAGGGLLLYDFLSDESDQDLSFAPSLSADGAGAVVEWRF